MNFKKRMQPLLSKHSSDSVNFYSNSRAGNSNIMRGLTFAALPLSLSLAMMQPAHADVYHAVEPGETLKSIAHRYSITAETIQTLNNLANTKETVPLPAMLLRIPEGKRGNKSDKSNLAAITALEPQGNTTATVTPSPTGTIAQSVRYTVLAGDTLEAIAERYARSGYPVTVEAIRQKNRLEGEPRVGSIIVVPLQSTTYRSAVQRPLSQRNASESPIVSANNPGSGADDGLPTVKVESSGEPVYRSIAENMTLTSKLPGRTARRGTVLSSRGYTPPGNRDGVRVLGQDENAPNPNPSTGPRVIKPPTQAIPAQQLAQVARVSSSGARIRRLPDSTAVTLYHCPVGTEMAIIKRSGAWSAILMSDRSTGWVPTRYLKFTGAQVDITSQVITGSAAWNNRTNQGSGSYSGHYNGNSPVVLAALKWLGTPYVYGGESRRGIDCSSLVQQSFRNCGYRLPRTAAQQARVGQAVDPANLRPGDRLYFSASGSRIDHTGLYMGNGQFVHASGRGRSVIVSNLFDAPHWNIFVCARR